jgi:hypothetical protein
MVPVRHAPPVHDRLHRFLIDSIEAHRSVEGALQRTTMVRTRAAAEPFVAGLHQAVQDGTLDVQWSHPLNYWNHLHVAAAAGDAELVRKLIEYGVPPNRPDRTGMTPLHLAAAGGSAESIERLLGCGVRANTQDSRRGWTALHFAASTGKLDAVQALLAAGANPLVKTWDGTLLLDLLRAATPEAARQASAYREMREALREAGERALTQASLLPPAQGTGQQRRPPAATAASSQSARSGRSTHGPAVPQARVNAQPVARPRSSST